MTQARLIICPTAPYDAPEQATDIKQALIDIGLLANEFEDNSYYAGTDFITLIMFLGCSPNIQLSPGDGNAFIYIRFSDISANSQQLGHGNSVAPGCPVCKSRLKDWKKTRNWQLADSKITCQQCNTQSCLADLKWRQEGSYGRFSISIMNIYAHEAVPADIVFQTLKKTSGFEWTYFYANNEN